MPVPWTLPQALESAAGSRAGVCYLADTGRESWQSYEALLDRSRAVAAHLVDRRLQRGDRVGIIVPEAEGFLATLFGASIAGLTVVPLAPPAHLAQLDACLESWHRQIRAADADAIVTTREIRSILGTVQAAAPRVRAVIPWEDLANGTTSFADNVHPADVALIQFTSGSTSQPKGVVITQENLRANINAIVGAGGLSVTREDVGVSWLPLFHDMGLIGVVLGSVTARIPLVLIPPLLFLKRPIQWLSAIARHHGTMSFAPSFGYDLCVKRAGDCSVHELDLSSWRVAGCGAEPIRARTLEEFSATFAHVGFRATSFLPCYGLAEHTLAATFHPTGHPWRLDTVRASALREEQVAVPSVSNDPEAIKIVSCGRPFPGHAVRVVDEAGRPYRERHVGEIVLAGPSVMRGYDREPELTRAVLRDGWLHTGDLGYLADGDLYVCGRKKDLIIVRGRNYSPQDFEWIAGEVPGVRRGNVVAFGTNGPDGTERIVLVVETKPGGDPDTLRTAVRRSIQEAAGVLVHDVVLAPRRSIPKTTSGKLQRARTKALYESGEPLATALRGRPLLAHLMSSRWGYAKVAARRMAARLRGTTDTVQRIDA